MKALRFYKKKAKRKGKIKALIFDVGGVLQLGKNPHLKIKKKVRETGIHETVAAKLNISLDQYFDAIDTIYAKSITGHTSKEKTLEIMAKNLNITPKKLEEIYIKAYKKNFKLNKKIFKYALRKKKQGYKIAILSDQWQVSEEVLITKKFKEHFSPLIVSTKTKTRKPDIKIYKLTLKELSVLPEETIFIDNQKWNILPAKKLGMKTVLFKNNKQAIREMGKILGE